MNTDSAEYLLIRVMQKVYIYFQSIILINKQFYIYEVFIDDIFPTKPKQQKRI